MVKIRAPKRGVVAATAILIYVLHYNVKYETWVAKEISDLKYKDTPLEPTRVLLQPHVSYCFNISMMVVVHSRLMDTSTRAMWRRTYGREELVTKYNYKLLFAVGTKGSVNDIDIIREEHGKHGDILQADFVDSYKNLTLKTCSKDRIITFSSFPHLSHLRYFTSACQQPTMLLKIDDDVVWRVDTAWRAAVHAANSSAPPSLSCLVWGGISVSRDPHSKWFVPPSIYAASEFPRYCSGMAYLASHSATTALTKWVTAAKFFWVDDVFVTGLVRVLAEVGLENLAEMYHFYKDDVRVWDNDSLAFQLVNMVDFESNFNEMRKNLQN